MAETKKQELLVKISPSIIVFIFLFLAGIWLLGKIKNILFMLFIAYIISVGLNKPIKMLQNKFKWQRVPSTLLVYFIFVVLVSLFIAIVVPPLVTEFSAMLGTVSLPPELDRMLNNFELNIQDIGKITEQLGGSLNTALGVISSTFGVVFLLLTTMVMSLYISIEKKEAVRDFSWLTHNPKTIKQLGEFIDQVNLQLGNWIRGEFILMLIVGGMTFIGVALIGVPYALPLALLAGLMEVVPNIGPSISAIPAILLALIALGWPGAIATLILYIVIQQLENNLIVPRVMKKNVDVSGLTSILGILIGGTLFGVVGALLAIPVFIVLRTIFETWLKYAPKRDLI